jgi:hypothetical protein
VGELDNKTPQYEFWSALVAWPARLPVLYITPTTTRVKTKARAKTKRTTKRDEASPRVSTAEGTSSERESVADVTSVR